MSRYKQLTETMLAAYRKEFDRAALGGTFDHNLAYETEQPGEWEFREWARRAGWADGRKKFETLARRLAEHQGDR